MSHPALFRNSRFCSMRLCSAGAGVMLRPEPSAQYGRRAMSPSTRIFRATKPGQGSPGATDALVDFSQPLQGIGNATNQYWHAINAFFLPVFHPHCEEGKRGMPIPPLDPAVTSRSNRYHGADVFAPHFPCDVDREGRIRQAGKNETASVFCTTDTARSSHRKVSGVQLQYHHHRTVNSRCLHAPGCGCQGSESVQQFMRLR